MIAPRLEACYFAKHPNEPWARLARVLSHTAAEHCAGWSVQIRQLATPPPSQLNAGFYANTYKLDHWCQLVQDASDGTELLLIDADTMIVQSLGPVWTQPFDLAYTVRASQHRFPFNAGVIVVRVSAAVRAFMVTWRDENRRLLRNTIDHQMWRRKYGGINQAALGSCLERGLASELRLQQLPCAEWNCEDTNWESFDPALTRIVHVKSALRRIVLGHAAPELRLKPVANYWTQRDRSAAAHEAGA